MTRLTSITLPALTMAALTAACSTAPAAPLVERSDSAGIEIVRNLGGDRPLPWTFEPVLRLGGADEGPESFYRLASSFVDTDDSGRIFVLDPTNHRVVVFDVAGRHLRSLGGKGAGPGEMEWPVGIAVAPDASVAVSDISRPDLLRWDSAGDPLSEALPVRPLAGQVTKAFAMLESGVVAVIPGPGTVMDDSQIRRRLVRLNGSDTLELATIATPRPAMIDLGCVGVQLPPRFSPDLIWDADRQRIAVTTSGDYDVKLVAGVTETRIRRDQAPREVTREMAMQDAGDGITVGFGDGSAPCKASPELLLERQGYAPVLPAIGAIALSPDGSIWIRRGAIKDEPHIVDVFDAEGVYLGTLPSDSPFPAAFTPDGDIMAIEKDEMDIDHLVIYRIQRDES